MFKNVPNIFVMIVLLDVTDLHFLYFIYTAHKNKKTKKKQMSNIKTFFTDCHPRYVLKADLHGTILVACDKLIRQAHDRADLHGKMFNPLATGDLAEKHVLKLVERFFGHCRAV